MNVFFAPRHQQPAQLPKLPANLCSPSETLVKDLSALILGNIPQVQELGPEDDDHAFNVSRLNDLPKTAEGRRILKTIYTTHCELKKVEDLEKFDDLKEVEERSRVEKEYLQTIDAISRQRRKFISPEDMETQRQAEQRYNEFFFPGPEKATFKVFKARQAFLDSIAEGLKYLESKGMRPTWHADNTRVINALGKAMLDPKLSGEDTIGIPMRSYAFSAVECLEYKNQFSHLFLRVALREMRNVITRLNQHSRILEIQFAALNCIKNLVQLRTALESLKGKKDIAAKEFAAPLLEFGFSFGKVKRFDFDNIVYGIKR